jgi:hypothetical protein
MTHEWGPWTGQHLAHLEALFSALAANGLAINLEKCAFAIPSLEILGHTISVGGSASMPDTLPRSMLAPPQDIKQLPCFLGMVNFYRSFFWVAPESCDH